MSNIAKPNPAVNRGRTGRTLSVLFLFVFLLMVGSGLSNASAIGPAAAEPVTSTAAVQSCPREPGHIACLSVHRPIAFSGARSRSTLRPSATTAGMTAYGPSDLAAAYRIPASHTAATVAIVDAFDAPTVEADLAVYRSQYGLPECSTANGCFRKVNQRGQSSPLPTADQGWAQESGLDVEMVSAVCPTCRILLVEADDDSLALPNIEASVKTATSMGARYVSMSWGTAETKVELSLDRFYLNVPGVTYVAASGDGDYGTSWPAASPNVVSVGGTSLRRASSASRGWTESVWGYTDGTGTGSGCSSQEPKPVYQRTISSTLCARRALNDVSVVGDPNTGVAVYQDGSWWQFGGTSAGSPIIAAMYALAGTPTSTSSPSYPYAHRGSFNDIKGIANGYCGNALCTAGPGWDGPSGVGSPIGVAGFDGIYSIAVHNPGAVNSYAGTGVGLNVQATDSGHIAVTYSASGLPAGTTLHSNGTITGAPSRAGNYTVTINVRDAKGSNGVASFRWRVVNHTMVTSSVPHISGALHRRATVTAVYGSFHQDSVRGRLISPAAHLQWYLDGRAIPGAVHPRLTIPDRYLHHRLSFALSASARNYNAYRHVTTRSAPIA